MNTDTPSNSSSKNGRTPDPDKKAGQAHPIPTPTSKDDAEVDLGQMPPSEGSGVLGGSRSQLSGPLSGTSVVSWADLMKTRSEMDINLDEPDSIEFDSPNDRDLAERARAELSQHQLGDVAQESSADALSDAGVSGIISVEPGSALFAQPGDGHADESSQVNLLSDLDDEPLDSSKRMPITDDVGNIQAKSSSSDSATDIGALPVGDQESSAVDLGSESFVDLPHPLPGGSSLKPGKPPSAAGSSTDGDSGTVDLLSSKREGTGLSSIPGLTAVGSSLRPDSAMPSTAKIHVDRSPWRGRIANGLVGAAAGVAACAGLYFGGILPQTNRAGDSTAPDKPISTPPTNPPATVQNQLDLEELKKLQASIASVREVLGDANLAPDQLSAAVGKLNKERDAAATDADKARAASQTMMKEKATAETQLQSAKDNLAQALADQRKIEDELKQARQQMAAAKPAADNAAEIANLKSDRERMVAKATQLEEQLAAAQQKTEEATRGVQDSATFVSAVRERLQTPADSTTAEVLSALDRAIAGKPAEAPARVSTSTPYSYNPQAERFFNNGLRNLFADAACDAEKDFQAAVGLNDRDARYWYFLGLAKLAQRHEATAEFSTGVELERRNLPNPVQMNAALERMPLEVRKIMSQVRGR